MSYKNTTREERARKHNCNGNCYGECTGSGCGEICGNIDICPETQNGEFIGTIVAITTIVMIPIAIVVVGIIFLVSVLR